jgi:hypothetical protein
MFSFLNGLGISLKTPGLINYYYKKLVKVFTVHREEQISLGIFDRKALDSQTAFQLKPNRKLQIKCSLNADTAHKSNAQSDAAQ